MINDKGNYYSNFTYHIVAVAVNIKPGQSGLGFYAAWAVTIAQVVATGGFFQFLITIPIF